MIQVSGKRMPLIHLDECIFCYLCVENCPRNAITASNIYDISTSKKDDLVLKPEVEGKDA